jgi:tRNA threonylcarbamoyladenosine biosynthesis protein TsaE
MVEERAQPGIQIDLADEADTDRLGRAIASAVLPDDVLGLIGPLGAGKTRLSRAIAESLGVDPREVSSPTFVLIHEYEGRLPVFHFDAYRLDGPAAFEALGVSDYWEAGGVCLVEWADRVSGVLPESTTYLTIAPTGETSRRIDVSAGRSSSFVERLERALAED